MKNVNVRFEYRLNSNATGDTVSVNGIVLTKSWKPFPSMKKELNGKIKTIEFPSGIVDYREVDHKTGVVLMSSSDNMNMVATSYTTKELSVMRRDELVSISRKYNIDPRNKSDKFLQRLIQDKQESYKDMGLIPLTTEQ